VTAAQRVQGLFTAPVVDADPTAALPWLAIAYVSGSSLQQAVADDGPRVIDFGIAHAAEATSLTRTGLSVGTPAFMTPEQVRGRPAVPATDVFGLGHLAVFAATGHAAFGEGNQDALLYRIIHEDPALDDCPEEVRAIALRCLAKDPDERPEAAMLGFELAALSAPQYSVVSPFGLPHQRLHGVELGVRAAAGHRQVPEGRAPVAVRPRLAAAVPATRLSTQVVT